jgi:hypothetical protein
VIRRLRQVHRVVFVFLALTIPVVMTRALASRPAEAGPAAPVGGLEGIDPSTLSRTWLTTAGPIRFRLEPPQAAAGPATLLLAPDGILRAPDLLLYWTPRSGPISAIVDGDTLLGRLTGTTPVSVRLPPEAAAGEGTVVLFSLAHQSVVAALPLDSTQVTGP